MFDESNLKLGKCIGSGKEGSIYRALNLTTGAIVAVKKVPVKMTNEAERKKTEVGKS